MLFFASIGRVILFPLVFIQQVISELRHITWPSGKETMRSTLIVIAFSLLVGIWIGGIDLLFTKALELVLK